MTIEDAAELRLRQRHVVRLEARPANLEGRGEVTIRQLVVNALRMRPDRIVVGEVRGAEALDMLQALNTGHDGSLTTVHANSPSDALRRIETLALMAGVGLPHAAVRDQVASALDLVVHQARLPDGSRVVESVTEVVRVAGGAGTRELWARGGGCARTGAGELAERLEALRGGALGVGAAGGAGWGVTGGARPSWRVPRAALLGLVELGRAAVAAARAARRALGARGRAGGRARAARARGARSGCGGAAAAAARGAGVAFVAARWHGRAARRAGGARAGRGRSRGCCARGGGATAGGGRGRRAGWRWRSRTRSAAALAARGAGRGGALGGRRGRATSCAAPPAELEAGAATEDALEAMRGRVRSPRMDTLVAACLLQRRAGGDLARLLRESAARDGGPGAARGRGRARPPPRPASPALLVVLLPVGGALLAELASPGWFAGLWSSFLTAWLVGIALVLQVVAAVLMRRLGACGDGASRRCAFARRRRWAPPGSRSACRPPELAAARGGRRSRLGAGARSPRRGRAAPRRRAGRPRGPASRRPGGPAGSACAS